MFPLYKKSFADDLQIFSIIFFRTHFRVFLRVRISVPVCVFEGVHKCVFVCAIALNPA